MSWKKAIKEYAKLSSAHLALLTSMIPLAGVLVMGETEIEHLLIVFIIGLLAHIYGFAFNHYNDIKIDSSTQDLKERPLPQGTITKKHALIYILCVLTLGFLLTIYFFSFKVLLIYITGIVFATVYDIFSKKIVGMDFFLAAGVSISAVFGSATVSFEFTNLAYIIWILCFIQTLNFNLIAGGIKDADHDFLMKSKHISTKLGVRVENKNLIVPNKFKLLAYSFAFLYIFFVFISIVYKWAKTSLFLILVLIVVNIFFIYVTYKMMRKREFMRKEILKYVLLQYNINWLNVPILIFAITPLAGILILFPLLGLVISNLFLYRTIFRPKAM
jgi:4-hydroxybenzoate polyprenyltransferase